MVSGIKPDAAACRSGYKCACLDNLTPSEIRGCMKVVVAVLGSPSLIVLMLSVEQVSNLAFYAQTTITVISG